MNILHVIRTMDPAWGGPVEGVRNIAQQAEAAGHNLQITCLDPPDSPWLRTLRVRVNAIGGARLGRFGFSRRLDNWLAEHAHEFDVLVSNGIWMYFSSAVRRAAIRAGIPYFVFTHGALDPWFKRHYPLKHIKKQVYWSFFERKVFRDASAILFTTSEEQAVSQGAFWPYVCNPKVVGYGIADPSLSADSLASGAINRRQLAESIPDLGDRRFVLFLARVHEKKGIDLLLQAIARNLSNYRDRAFVIAGPGDGEYIDSLKSLAAQLGLGSQVIWAGPLYGRAKWAAVRSAEAYVLPSHQENFGISVVEALACGAPVLITDKVNIWREIVAEGAGLVESDDVSGICTLLEKWSRLNSEERAAMSNRARRCFETYFDIANTSSNFFDFLEAHTDRADQRGILECVS
jgi:glycosyltransferase involved in cell wall biosynthesis